VKFSHVDDFASPVTQQASIGIDRSLGTNLAVSANFIFVRGARIPRSRDTNLLDAPVDSRLGIRIWSTPYFKDPLLLQDNIYESTANSLYHGLTLELRRRSSGRFGFEANYTLSKAMDDAVDFNSDFQAADQTNLQAERALSSFDQRHKLVALAAVRLPHGLQWTPVLRVNSGRPFNLLAGFDLNRDRHATTDRPAGAGRNTGRGPGYWGVDMRVSKTVSVRESARMELIVESFNVFNRLNYRSINNIVGNRSGPFNLQGRADLEPGEPLSFTSAFAARQVQVGMRLSY
jgi:hypothetical protein